MGVVTLRTKSGLLNKKAESCIVVAIVGIALLSPPFTMLASTTQKGLMIEGWLNISPAFAAEQPSESRSFTLLVSSLGFNETKQMTLTVNEGDLVKITLIYDDDAVGDNPHLVKVEGYGVEAWVKPTQRTSTLTFRALQAGSFKIRCANEQCEGHENIQGLTLQIKTVQQTEPKTQIGKEKTNETGAARPQEGKSPDSKTELTLRVSFPDIIRLGYNLTLTSVLRDVKGEPVAGMPITFYVNTTWGEVKVGRAHTDGTGVALLKYRPFHSSSLVFKSTFAGGAGYQASSSERVVKELPSLSVEDSSSEQVRGQNRFIDTRLVGAAPPVWYTLVPVVFAVVAAAWATLASVFLLMSRIKRESRDSGRPESSLKPSRDKLGGAK